MIDDAIERSRGLLPARFDPQIAARWRQKQRRDANSNVLMPAAAVDSALGETVS